MRNTILKQPFKIYNLMVFFTALLSVLLLTSFPCVKGANEPAQSQGDSNDKSATEPAQPQKQSTGTTMYYLKRIESIDGIAWDGKYLLALDGKKGIIDRINISSGDESVQPLALDQKKLKGLAFDGEVLWTFNEKEKTLIKINPKDGRTIGKAIEMEIPVNKGFRSVESLTWDGEYLWVAIYAGFSSSFNQINPDTGKIVKSIFADCYPRGIATDGKYFWSICYNINKFPSKIEGKKIERKKIQGKDHEIFNSIGFIMDIPKEAEPVGLTFVGTNLWYADRVTKSVFGFTPTIMPPVQKK